MGFIIFINQPTSRGGLRQLDPISLRQPQQGMIPNAQKIRTFFNFILLNLALEKNTKDIQGCTWFDHSRRV
jgi:hypothetical protein